MKSFNFGAAYSKTPQTVKEPLSCSECPSFLGFSGGNRKGSDHRENKREALVDVWCASAELNANKELDQQMRTHLIGTFLIDAMNAHRKVTEALLF